MINNKKSENIIDVRNKTIKEIKIKSNIIHQISEYTETDVNDTNRNFIIVRNIKTENEQLFSSMSKVGQFLNFDAKSVLTYMNSSRLVYGCHIRSFGKPYFNPHDNLKYDATSKPFMHSMAVKSTNLESGEINIYESISEASRLLGQDEAFRSRIGKYANKDKVFMYDGVKLKWAYVTNDDCGTFINCPNTFDTIDGNKIIPKDNVNVKFPKNNMLTLVNIKTKERIGFSSISKLSKFINYDVTDIVDLPMQIKGYIVSKTDSGRLWVPPDNFKFVENYASRKNNSYVKVTNIISNEVSYYNSMIELAVFFNLCKIDDSASIKDTVRESVRRVVDGEVKNSLFPELNKFRYEKVETCGSWVYSDGRIECV